MTSVTGAALELLEQWLPADAVPDRPQMQVCTVDEEGRPDARTVLLSEWGPAGFVFHTDSGSRKAVHIRARGAVALVLLWPGFTRQLTVQGTAEEMSAAAARPAYDRRSPYLRQLAWQNTAAMAPAPRAERVTAWSSFARTHDPGALSPPPTWTGFLVRPDRLTFWRSDADGPSHRTEHRRGADGWTVHRLAG